MSPTDVITAAGAMLTGLGLIYTGIQLRLSRKTARSQFLIQLYQLMEQHHEVHGRGFTEIGRYQHQQDSDIPGSITSDVTGRFAN